MELIKEHHHFIIYKPYGYLSQFIYNQNRRTNKKLLGSLYDFPENTMAIGRLDEHSEGLLFLTTDGAVSEYIRSSKVDKEYYAQVDGNITSEAIEKLKNGVEIGFDGKKYSTKKCNAFKVLKIPEFPLWRKKIRNERHGPTSWVSITLNEGKFRQVRKMTAAVGFPTLRLIRVRIGKTLVSDMDSGAILKVNSFNI